MAEKMIRYMTVMLVVTEEGVSLSCWMSVEELWAQEVAQFPHKYTFMGDRCTWFVHSNSELTGKMVALAGETADKICAQQIEINYSRKLANR